MASGSLYCSRGPFTSAYQKTSAPTSSSKATLEEGVGSFKFRTLKGLSRVRALVPQQGQERPGRPWEAPCLSVEGLRPGKTFVAESSAPGPAAARRKASPFSALPRFSSGRTSTWPSSLILLLLGGVFSHREEASRPQARCPRLGRAGSPLSPNITARSTLPRFASREKCVPSRLPYARRGGDRTIVLLPGGETLTCGVLLSCWYSASRETKRSDY